MQKQLEKIIPISQAMKLLYVEDNKKAREATLPLLYNFFVDITTVDNGENAFELYQTQTFDIIFTDISLSSLSGIELIEKIRKEDKNISIVVLTAYNDNNYLLQAIRLDVDGYIIKPLMLEQLLTTLHKVVRKQQLERQKSQTNRLYKRLEESIKFASAIQHSLITPRENFEQYFQDHFTLWEPRDIVGGDFYFFSTFEDESALLMLIDCTGHGVHGAFLAMLCEVIYRQIITRLKDKHSIFISPAQILMEFHLTLIDIFHNTASTILQGKGFDGQVVYICKRSKKLKFAGAKNPLYYIQKNKLYTLPADKHSVGYNTLGEFKFQDKLVDINEGARIYLSTDGFWDQIGGNKRLPFGKKRFERMLQEHHEHTMSQQKEIFIKTLRQYQELCGSKRVDDMACIGVLL